MRGNTDYHHFYCLVYQKLHVALYFIERNNRTDELNFFNVSSNRYKGESQPLFNNKIDYKEVFYLKDVLDVMIIKKFIALAHGHRDPLE